MQPTIFATGNFYISHYKIFCPLTEIRRQISPAQSVTLLSKL